MNSLERRFQNALAALGNCDFKTAATQFKKILNDDPRHVAALNFVTIALMQMGHFVEAEGFIKRALQLNANSDASFYNYGLILRSLNRFEEALLQLDRALQLNPSVSETWNNRGLVLGDLKRHDEAVADFNRAISIDGRYAAAHVNKGKSLIELKRFEDALAAFDRAIFLQPELVGGWQGRGAALTQLERYDEALDAFERALSLRQDYSEAWTGKGIVFTALKLHDEAFAAFDEALRLNADSGETWFRRGNLLNELNLHDDAITAFNKAISLKSDIAEAWFGLGCAFIRCWRYEEAFDAINTALSLKSDLAEAWVCRGTLFAEFKRYDEALVSLDKALSISPWIHMASGHRIHAKLFLCDWTNIDHEISDLLKWVGQNKVYADPFQLISISSSAGDQLLFASNFSNFKFRSEPRKHFHADNRGGDKIRIAYMSTDFREHPVAHLTAGLFEQHDRTSFEVTGISLVSDSGSGMQARLKNAFDTFIDASKMTDDDIVRYIEDSKVDILIDLNGYTGSYRTEVFSSRPAPIQVNYLGYPGTVGADFIDYIIADPVIIPEHHRGFYAEKVVYLPHTYMANDSKREISATKPSRSSIGLPEDGFVFCCFNNNYKILPEVFDSWMRILKSVDASVLWLAAANPIAMQNLRQEAAVRGVDASRLIFADRIPQMSDHLARIQAADLFLDTLPYNAHATASDALWAGVPVLTLIGDTFAGRVAASLLNAVDLPELITKDRAEYEAFAVRMARDPGFLASIEKKLSVNRLRTPLFDTQRFTRNIEKAYQEMYSRYRNGLGPDCIRIFE